MWQLSNSNQFGRWPMNMTLTCLLQLVLTTGLDELRAMQGPTVKRFGSVVDLSRNPSCCISVGKPRTCPPGPAGIPELVWSHLWQYPVRVFRFFYQWSHSDFQLFIANHWLQYVIVVFWVIDRLYNQKTERHTPCPVLKMRVNTVSMIVGLESWVIWVAIECRYS